MRIPLLCCLLLWLSGHGIAWACESDDACIAPNSWKLGIAVGIGARTNPLVDGDPIPLVVLPDVAWYGENAYFDNGEAGYQWQLRNDITTELFVMANRERAYFNFWHPANIVLSVNTSAADVIGSPLQPGDSDGESPAPRDSISIKDISSRKWTADAGLRVNWNGSDSLFSATVAGDLLGVHQGYYAQLKYQYRWQWDDWQFAANASVTYKSERLIDYYYGIDSEDTANSSLWYAADHALQTSVGLLLNKPLNKHWRWVGRVQLSTLGSGMTDSPLVSKDYVASGFIGFGYQF